MPLGGGYSPVEARLGLLVCEAHRLSLTAQDLVPQATFDLMNRTLADAGLPMAQPSRASLAFYAPDDWMGLAHANPWAQAG